MRDHRGSKVVLLVLLEVKSTEQRLKEFARTQPGFQSANVEVIIIPTLIDLLNVADRLPGVIVSEGIRQISETYKLFARSFSDESRITSPRPTNTCIRIRTKNWRAAREICRTKDGFVLRP